MARHPVVERSARHVADLRRVLEYPLSVSEQESFEDMLSRLEREPHAYLSDRQEGWLRHVLERHEPTYKNLASTGQVSTESRVELMVRDHPLRPPGRCR